MYAIRSYYGGGLIPSYLLVNKLGLYNTMFAVIIPGMVSIWNIIRITSYNVCYTKLLRKLTMPSITSTSGPMMVDAASIITGSTEFNEDKAFEQLAALNPSVVKSYNFV